MPGRASEATLQVAKDDHVRGSNTAPVTLLVYGDYECPYTRALELSLAQLRRRDGKSFRSVFRFFPLREIHPHAQQAAEAAEAVSALAGHDAFWLMHDALFSNQDDLEMPSIERQATTAGAERSAFRAALETHKFASRIERDVRSGRANGVAGTPSVFLNSERYLGERDVATLRDAIKGAAR